MTNTGARRARLMPSPREDARRRQVHDFRNNLTELSFAAANLDDKRLVEHYADELLRRYEAALDGKP